MRIVADLWRVHAADPDAANTLVGWKDAGSKPAVLCKPLPLYPAARQGDEERQVAVDATRAGRAARLVEAISLSWAEGRAP